MGEYSGYVYILSNPAMPGIYKIGRSKHGGRVRARDIYKQGGTGVPMPYKMEFELWTEDCIQLEDDVHNELQEKRINKDREFFKIDLTEAIQAVMRVFGYDHQLIVGNEIETVEVCNIKNAYNGAQLYTKKTGNDIRFGAVSASISSHLSVDAICKALEEYEASCQLRCKSIEQSNG